MMTKNVCLPVVEILLTPENLALLEFVALWSSYFHLWRGRPTYTRLLFGPTTTRSTRSSRPLLHLRCNSCD
ncbi:hypothetical protein DPMN_065021 [Dreissena polymorpha]|uniref:Uncharacterized protein n=1 Tax=Dreissena polymorpha TaxID=45954 RepID=A0A9D4CEE9_DREPO|nr:hypothetical protein DPMN_065021 [Dreissena polymorpha]